MLHVEGEGSLVEECPHARRLQQELPPTFMS
jgi:hypothetical protein